MINQLNSVSRNTAWPLPSNHGGLVRTMAEIQGEQERTRQKWDQWDKFYLKAEATPISKRRAR